jgi:bifunctional non-homologous end joining protein LigD
VTALPAWIEPQLATLTRDRFSDPAWLFERKLDGERCLAFADDTRIRLMSRNDREITSTFPEIAQAMAEQASHGTVVDGEIVAFAGSQTSFSLLQQRLGRAAPGDDLLLRVPAYFYLFDVMFAEGRDTRSLPQRERKEVLAQLLTFAGPLRYTGHREGDGEQYFRQACADGWEGLIAKRADARYVSGRTRNWLKFKCENGQEFVIGGYTDPRGSRRHFGALLLGYYDKDGRLAYAGKVGTGFSAEALERIHAELSRIERAEPAFESGSLPAAGVHWVQPRLVGQVGFTEWTRDGELRHPRFQGLRFDKDAAEVVREDPRGGADPAGTGRE